jgi:hypothetical protein
MSSLAVVVIAPAKNSLEYNFLAGSSQKTGGPPAPPKETDSLATTEATSKPYASPIRVLVRCAQDVHGGGWVWN